jgi:hypothetical protein
LHEPHYSLSETGVTEMPPRKTSSEVEAAAHRSRAALLQAKSPTKRAETSGSTGKAARPGFAFLAYAREDTVAAAALVATLRQRGLSVKWDRDLRGGERFRQRIGQLIEAAAAVIVIWSAASVVSDFVIDEAEAGKTAGKLVTCRTDAIKDSDIPFGFRGLHCADVTDIDGLVEALGLLGMEPEAA